MNREKLLAQRVIDRRITLKPSVNDLFALYSTMGGFTARYLAESRDILRAMFADKDSFNFLSFTADLVATGLRGILAQLIETGYFGAVVTTCGSLDHDIARACGARYCFGSFDANDEDLRRVKISRLGNIFIPMEDYGMLTEKFVRKCLETSGGTREVWGGRELVELFADSLPRDRNSILRAARRSGTRVFVPGLMDGAVGTHIFMHSQSHRFVLNPFKDMSELSDIVFEAKKTGALVIGGGISKHHTIWWNQFKDGLDYAIYLTTASEYDGSLSGARTREAISWNKLKPRARQVTVLGDATVTLPLLAATALSAARND
jgi:deoxyhypusine synthase